MKLLTFIMNLINVNESAADSIKDSLNDDHKNNSLFKFSAALKAVCKLRLKLMLTL